MLLVSCFVSASPAAEWKFPTLQGGEVPLDDLYRGKWCLMFVVAPDCTACAAAIGWLEAWKEEQTESRVQTALVVPWDTPELRTALAKVSLPVIVDAEFLLASWFKVKAAPTAVLFAEGTFEEVLEWPFSAEELWGKLSELREFVIPRARDLLGQAVLDFTGTDLSGAPVNSWELPRPALLFFFSTTCPACHASLEMLPYLTEEVPVVLLVLTHGHELTPEDREELKSIRERYHEQLYIVILGVNERKTEERFRIRWVPTFFLVNADGRFVAVWEGPTETLPQEVEELLENIEKNEGTHRKLGGLLE